MIAHAESVVQSADSLADWDAQCDAHDVAMAVVEAQRPEPSEARRPEPWDDFPRAVRDDWGVSWRRESQDASEAMWGYE